MRALYDFLRDCYGKQLCVVFTVIRGEYFGDKALFINRSLRWTLKENPFWERHKEIFSDVDASGVMDVDKTAVFCEVVSQEKKLVICGGGHVSIPLIKIGTMMGYEVTVLEDREKFASDAKEAGAQKVCCNSYEESLNGIEGDADTFFVIVTRGHRYDKVCLEQIIRKKHAYIGMIGSKNRVIKVKEELAEKGCNQTVLDTVYSPIGLNINSETPEEIAVSIFAEIISVKNKHRRSTGYSKKLIREIFDRTVSEKERCVIATIIRRAGSAPREVGTKMAVFPDGVIAGTIGGGKMEADVTERALDMIKKKERSSYIARVDMSGKNAEEDGMVCGGNVDILYEII